MAWATFLAIFCANGLPRDHVGGINRDFRKSDATKMCTNVCVSFTILRAHFFAFFLLCVTFEFFIRRLQWKLEGRKTRPKLGREDNFRFFFLAASQGSMLRFKINIFALIEDGEFDSKYNH
jgi:hypothetical protein